MKRFTLVAAFAASVLGAFLISLDEATAPGAPVTPELAYLKQVNEWRPPSDPQLLFILMAQFANANRHGEGAAFFEAVLARFRVQLDDTNKAQYLSAIAALRAGHATQVSLLRRIAWVRDTVRLLDEAKQLTKGEAFITRWMSGAVRAQIPALFGESDAALEDLFWCVEHVDRAPHPGWLREVYAHLAALHRARDEHQAAQRYQALSGYQARHRSATFTTPFSYDPALGHTFSSRVVREVVPHKVYLVSGYEFTEYYFVASEDRRELVAIDAGTRPDSARAAYEALRSHAPHLPPLTTVFVTHAHWDHVGGHRYFRSLNPTVRFIGRSNYEHELALGARANPAMLQRFFGRGFRLEDVLNYVPDVKIDRETAIVVGGTSFSLLPTRGGETDDALLVYMPRERVLFVGDIAMPYFGAPFVDEGSIDGLLGTIDEIEALQPDHLLHGHEPLTRVFSSTRMLTDLRGQLSWLRDEVLNAIQRGEPRGVIQQANLVPPTLERSASEVHLAYLVMRENIINRLFDQHSGYWQNGLQGLDALTDTDRGSALVEYLDVSERDLADAIERMVADGRHELAAAILQWSSTRFPNSERLAAARELTYLKLMEKYQEFNPFKFIVYAGEIGRATAQINVQADTNQSARPVAGTTGER